MRRRHRRPQQQQAELDITAFMNLMIVLVPVLLLSLVFAHTAVLDLRFPTGEAVADSLDEKLQLQVIINPDALIIADSKVGVITQIANQDGGYDLAQLQTVLKDIKARLPDKKDIAILSSDDTSYQTLVAVMDTARSFKTVVAANLVNAELFPNISLGDAPDSLPTGGNG